VREVRHRPERGHLGDVRADLLVHRRDDLASVAQVDLVAVVGGRVVARRDHDAGGAPEVPHGERQHRGRQVRREHHHAEAGAGEDLGGHPGEQVGVVTGVVADHDGATAVLVEVAGQAGRGARHDHEVHPVGAGADAPAQAGGAELQGPGERVVELGSRAGVAGLGRVQQGGELLAHARIGVGLQPVPCGLCHVHR
jgi:hypothetical protein